MLQYGWIFLIGVHLLDMCAFRKIMAERLTKREHQVLILVAQGKANKEIVRELCIAVRTAEYHITNILGKLGAANRTEAVVMALARGLLDLADL